jgi:hypothetical protein
VLRVINERYEHERRLGISRPLTTRLTGELNRHQLSEVLEDAIDEALRFRSSCGFLLDRYRQSGAHQRLFRVRHRRSTDQLRSPSAAQL